MIQIFLLRYWKELAALALLAFAVWRGYDWAYDNGSRDVRADWDKDRAALLAEQVKQSEAARVTERRHMQAIADIAERYEQDKRNAQAEQEALVNGLRTGNRRLRNLWQGCQATGRVSGAAAGAAESDAENRLREESAGRIIGAVRACQIQRNSLIDVIEAERK